MRFWLRSIIVFAVLLPRPAHAHVLHIDAVGRIVSANALWNVCTHGEPILLAMIRANPDVFIHRQGRIIVKIPYTCRDYHRGDVGTWKYPDVPDTELVLDRRGRLIDTPPGFTLERVVASKSTP